MSAPTKPGWWWRESTPGYRECVRVQWHSLYPSEVVWYPTGRAQGQAVTDDSHWLCEVPTPERIAADAERLERVTQTVATEIAEAAAMFEHLRGEYHRGVHNGLVMVRAVLSGDVGEP